MSTPPTRCCSLPPLRLLLIDRHALFRQALSVLCEHASPFRVLADMGSLPESNQVVGEADAVIINLDVPGTTDSDLLRRLQRLNPKSRILALVSAEHHGALSEARALGSVEVLSTDVGLDDLMHAVQNLDPRHFQVERG